MSVGWLLIDDYGAFVLCFDCENASLNTVRTEASSTVYIDSQSTRHLYQAFLPVSLQAYREAFLSIDLPSGDTLQIRAQLRLSGYRALRLVWGEDRLCLA